VYVCVCVLVSKRAACYLKGMKFFSFQVSLKRDELQINLCFVTKIENIEINIEFHTVVVCV